MLQNCLLLLCLVPIIPGGGGVFQQEGVSKQNKTVICSSDSIFFLKMKMLMIGYLTTQGLDSLTLS